MDHVDGGSPTFDMNWASDPTQFTSRPASNRVRRVRPTANTSGASTARGPIRN